ncbi:MAG: ATPase [Thermoanaerobacteraceae bacterium]|nr:ATPase [Thermoanaerobacteraceae bacterium]
MEQINGCLKLMDDLEELIVNGTRVPMSGKVIVDQELVLEIIDKIRGLLPAELHKAQQINQERKQLLHEAKLEAERILNEARSHIDRMISEEEIVKQAKSRGEDIIKQAEKTAKQIREGSTNYADDILSNLEASLEKTLSVVRKGRQELQATKSKYAS